MSYLEIIRRWRALPEARQREIRWREIPRQVAASMAFEGEPVDLEWLEKIHHEMPRPAGLKPAGASSVTPS